MAAIGTVFFLFAAACSSYLATRAADRREHAAAVGETAPEEAAAEAPLPPPPRRRRAGALLLRTLATVALLLLAASWLVPYLSARAESAALDAWVNGDTAAALSHARRAARLDPLAVEPLITQSQLLRQQGRKGEALALLEKAARLQPENYQVFYHQGVLLLQASGRKQAAIAALRRALALNPLDAASRSELELATGP